MTSELRPDLQLVRTELVRFHEHPERRRTLKLRERVEREGTLRNPPIVAPMADGRYLLLDGANRVSAFADMGHAHVPVQVVDYADPAVELKGWHHLLMDAQDLRLHRVYGDELPVALQGVARDELPSLLGERRVYAVLVEGSDACWGLFPREAGGRIDSRHWVEIAERVVGAYEGQARLERIKLADYAQLPEVVQGRAHQLVLFPVLGKRELLELAGDDIMIPTGLTRHLIPGRALALNLDVGFLSEPWSEEEKARHLREHVDRLSVEGRIRFYEESVFVMNE